jgi:hypothetical protein
MRKFSDERCRANKSTHAKFNNIFSKIVPWKNTVEPDRPQKTIWCMHISWSIPKATNTNSEFVILIALPLQHWLHERTWMLRYTYITCVVYYVSKAIPLFLRTSVPRQLSVISKYVQRNPRQRGCSCATTMFMPDPLYRPSIRKSDKQVQIIAVRYSEHPPSEGWAYNLISEFHCCLTDGHIPGT